MTRVWFEASILERGGEDRFAARTVVHVFGHGLLLIAENL